MRLSIVVTVLGQHEMAVMAINKIRENITDPSTEIVIVDNGGDMPPLQVDHRLRVISPVNNLGVYPVFKHAMEWTAGDVVAFLHSDLIVAEKGFDAKILGAFRMYPNLGLVGFVGSNEIDANGGRGGGTTSNFQGGTYRSLKKEELVAGDTVFNHWTGSPAEAHGKRNAGFTNAAVVDGCAMVIRRSAWDKIGFREGFPPHHFYDRLISTQMIEAGYKVAVLGIACDHLGGQTVSREQRYPDMAKEWCEAHLTPDRFMGNPPNYDWDITVYREAELQWLREYRDKKHLVPIKV